MRLFGLSALKRPHMTNATLENQIRNLQVLKRFNEFRHVAIQLNKNFDNTFNKDPGGDSLDMASSPNEFS